MAQAVEQHTPIEWTLPDLLEYLTLAPFGYSISRALREMSQAIATGKLPLKREYYVDGKFHTDWFDPFRFHLNYTLELDRVTAVVRVVKWGWLPGETSFHYTVAEQDVLDLWPPHSPASQTVPDKQLEDKIGPDPFRTGVAGRPSARDFILAEAKRRIAEKEVTPTPKGLKAFSEVLEKWWDVKRLTFDPPGPPMKAGSISNVVREAWNKALNAQN